VLADFGTDYTDVGWLTIVLPLVVLALVIGWWNLMYRANRRSRDHAGTSNGGSNGAESEAGEP
jgi:hypothetical protein